VGNEKCFRRRGKCSRFGDPISIKRRRCGQETAFGRRKASEIHDSAKWARRVLAVGVSAHKEDEMLLIILLILLILGFGYGGYRVGPGWGYYGGGGLSLILTIVLILVLLRIF
jgi:Protein of unknown function (DUF3309)